MTHPSKRKGNSFERELVAHFIDAGLCSERAYASNGKSLGEAEEVDVTAQGCRIQAKRRKSLPKYLQIPVGTDCVVFRQDRGETLVLLSLDDFVRLIKDGW